MTRNMKYILIERHWFVSKVVSGCLLYVCRLIDFRRKDATQLFVKYQGICVMFPFYTINVSHYFSFQMFCLKSIMFYEKM